MQKGDWFEWAIEEVDREAKERAKRLNAVQEQAAMLEAKIKEMERTSKLNRTSTAAGFASIFSGVKAGTIPTVSKSSAPTYSNRGYEATPRRPTAQQGLEAILDAIRDAGDADEVMAAAGLWITKITNEITAIVREADDK